MYAENRDRLPSGRWLGRLGYTILIAVFVIRDGRQNWRRSSFWLTLVGLFAAHTALYAVAFKNVQDWRGIWFLPISIVEYVIFVAALQWLGYGDDSNTANPHARHRS